MKRRIFIIFIIGILLVGTIGATLSSSKVRDYIIDSFQSAFNIETDPVIIKMNIGDSWKTVYG